METSKEIRSGGKEPPPNMRSGGGNDPTRRFDDAYLDYSRAVQGISIEVGRSLDDFKRKLAADVHAAMTQPDAAMRIQDVRKEAERAMAGVDDSLGVRKRLDEAYAGYLEAVKAAWAAVDPRALPPATLAGILNTLAAGLQCKLATGSA